MKVLITCPPMLRSFQHVAHYFEAQGVEYVCPNVTQTLSESELLTLVPQFDGWIIGDDPATRAVFAAGQQGKLKAAVKWGVGVDNVDLVAARELGLPIINTPGMFGKEVADIAVSYVIALARHTYLIDRGVRAGRWLKPVGHSLADKTVALVGFGDIGRNTARRLLACDMKIIAYDPYFKPAEGLAAVTSEPWPNRLGEADFIVLTCALTPENRHLINAESLAACQAGVRIVNVSRGPLIDETALAAALASGHVAGAALEVAEIEPLPPASPLREFEQCLFGSHNASNTLEAVIRTSEKAIAELFGLSGGCSCMKKFALITGALGGIGQALCTAFQQAGYFVIGTDRQPGAGSCNAFIQLDVRHLYSRPSERQRVVAETSTLTKGAGLKVLVNNAATQMLNRTDDIRISDWDETLETNLIAPFLLIQSLLAELELAQGSVINIASIHAAATKPGFVCYATSKAALVGLTRALAVDLGPRVRINCLSPAATATPMLLAGFEGKETEFRELAQMHPLERIADPLEVAQAAVFLASEGAGFITGTCLSVDGGIAGRLHDPV